MKVTNFTDQPEHSRFIEKLQLGSSRDTEDFKKNPENAKTYGESYFSVRNELLLATSSGSLDRSNAIKLHFLRNFEGDFEKDKIVLKRACREAKTLCQESFVDFELSGKITNYGNQTLSGVVVTLLGSTTLYNQEISAVSNQNGEYHLRGKIAPYSRLRFRASSNQTTPAYFTYSLIGGEGTRFSQTKDFRLFIISKSFEIDTKSHTIYSPLSSMRPQYTNEIYTIDGQNIKMEIPEKAIIKRDGTPYIGKVSVFIPIKSSEQRLDADIFETGL